jgi:hypothetical protein
MRSARIPTNLRPLLGFLLGGTLLFAAAACESPPPAPTVVEISRPDASLNMQFTEVISVRELSDGRILIADQRDAVLYAGDFTIGTAVAIGRQGDGPGEYRTVGRLWPVAGDTSYVAEPYSPRAHFLVTDSIATWGMEVPHRNTRAFGVPLGFNAQRELFGRVAKRDAQGKLLINDSTYLVRGHIGEEKYDTIGALAPGNTTSEIGVDSPSDKPPTPGKKIFSLRIEAADEAAVFADGSYAIVRGDPYRVDWCVVGKTCVAGPVISDDRPETTDADRSAITAALIRSGRINSAEEGDEIKGIPDRLPPYAAGNGPDNSAVYATPSGNVVIERLPNAEHPGFWYDVVDRTGKRIASLRMPAGEFIVGFGRRSAYSVSVSSDGTQRLQRHPWAY